MLQEIFQEIVVGILSLPSNQIVLGWYLLLFDYKLQQNRDQVWFW
jgi:hypothetical protein